VPLAVVLLMGTSSTISRGGLGTGASSTGEGP
jgi:hypothetical protein